MRPLSSIELLTVWEQARLQSPVRRPLALLAAGYPELPVEELAHLSIGRRDTLLLTMREWAFGPRITTLATCPGCGDQLDLTFGVADVRVASDGAAAGVLAIELEQYAVCFRLPNSLDLEAIVGLNAVAGRAELLRRCLLELRQAGATVAAEALPAELVTAIVERMEQADPQADVRLALSCPSCNRQWSAIFDIANFLWSELENWAIRLLHEVHVLAAAYHWSQADILALSPWRRQFYLELVQG